MQEAHRYWVQRKVADILRTTEACVQSQLPCERFTAPKRSRSSPKNRPKVDFNPVLVSRLRRLQRTTQAPGWSAPLRGYVPDVSSSCHSPGRTPRGRTGRRRHKESPRGRDRKKPDQRKSGRRQKAGSAMCYVGHIGAIRRRENGGSESEQRTIERRRHTAHRQGAIVWYSLPNR